jgi:transposase
MSCCKKVHEHCQSVVAPHTLRVQSVEASPKGTTVRTMSLLKTHAVCPICQHLARRIPSHYGRRAENLPWLGIAVRLELQVRRFFCDELSCPQRIFYERTPTLVVPHALRTVRLHTALQRVSFALGGEAGARLATELAMAVSGDTLLRCIRQVPPPPLCTHGSYPCVCVCSEREAGAKALSTPT